MTTLLIVEDDKNFSELLAENFIKRGLEVKCAASVLEAIKIAEDFNPEWVLTDLKMPGNSGLELIPKLLEIDRNTRIVILTGYATIKTAIEAIKLGAIHYLSKPASVEEIITAFHQNTGNPSTPVDTEKLTLGAAEKEYIFTILKQNNHNISATARELGMHRRTLQRKLDKLR